MTHFVPDPDHTACLVRQIVDYLFTNGMGEQADRLVLTSKDGRDLGGWCRAAVLEVIKRGLAEVRQGVV